MRQINDCACPLFQRHNRDGWYDGHGEGARPRAPDLPNVSLVRRDERPLLIDLALAIAGSDHGLGKINRLFRGIEKDPV